MASIGWKRFKFFEEQRFDDASLPQDVTATCPGADGDVWLGCSDGLVLCANRDCTVTCTVPAHQGRVHTILADQGKLITVGEDGDGLRGLTLKAWELSALRGSVTAPSSASVKLFPSGKLPEGSLQAAAVCARQWPAFTLALGLSTGAVHLFRGDAVKGKVTQVHRHHMRTAGSDGVTGLHFAGSGSDRHVFAVSDSAVAALAARTGQVLLEDDCGAAARCSAVTPKHELMLAGPDAVHFYSAEEGRKAAFAVKGAKHAVAAFKQYLVAVVPEAATAGPSSSPSAPASPALVLRVFDLANKVVAASTALTGQVQWLVADATGAVVADAGGRAVRLLERPLADRLDSLYRSRSFQLALSVAAAHGADARTMAEVRRRYGDFLYGKRDYDGAAEQYAATVGSLEPSYPIQRFLDAQRIHNLTSYLEALHAAGLATADHTTLLLNCYTKLRDVAKLDAFVQGSGEPSGAGVRFDADAAITVLRAAGYYEHALYVALAAGESDCYLEVLLEDCGRCDEALQYMRSLGRRTAAAGLLHHGKTLLQTEPVATTALLMELCLPPGQPSGGAAAALDDADYVADLADFTHLYADRPDDLRYACVTILGMGHPDLPSRQALYHTLLDLYLGGTALEPATTPGEAGERGSREGTTAAGISISTGASNGSAAPGSRNGADTGRTEALELLRAGWLPGQEPAYAVDRALTVCRLHSFSSGLVFLHSNLRLYREAAAVLAADRDWAGLLDMCERHGAASSGGDPALWHDALEALSAPHVGSEAEAALRSLLVRIEAADVLPPLAVLPVLARNPHLHLELVKDYVARALAAENRAIRADQEEAESLAEEVTRTRAATAKLCTEPFVVQASRDSLTNAPLELPSVHFFCGHSFNARSLGDSQECPLCAPEHARVADLQRSHRSAAAGADAFFRQLKSSSDGFGVVAGYFGKGLLNNTSTTCRS